MSRLCVVPIVEGHGEDNAIRILIQRVWTELLGGSFVEVVRPIRWPRTKLIRPAELQRAVNLASLKIATTESSDPALILILLDSDEDLPCVLGPQLLGHARSGRPDVDITCVLANVEYETWFVASAPSLTSFLDFTGDVPRQPEEARLGKAWIERHFRGVKYSETLDQPAMTSRMNLALCRERSPSFDKLCRELAARLGE